MRPLALLLTAALAAPLLAQPPTPTAGERVLAFAQAALGKRVGKGVCVDLALAAVKAAGAKPPHRFKPDPQGDPAWGHLVYATHNRGTTPQAIRPGDIVVFRDARFHRVERTPTHVSWRTVTALRHAAIVENVADQGQTLGLLEQNANDQPFVTRNTLDLRDLKSGTLTIYRPHPNPPRTHQPQRPNAYALQGIRKRI